MCDLFWFSDVQWARIEPLLPRTTRGMKRVDDRRVLSGIVHVIKSGGRWADAPREYGPKKTLYNRFVRWAERGIWKDIFAALAARDGVPDRLIIDSTIVKAHRSAGGGKGGPRLHAIGRSKGGRTTKIHVVSDGMGRPCVMLLTPGNTNDHKAAVPCLDAMPPSAHLIADKGYDSAAFRDWLRKRGTTPVIPPRKSRKVQYRYDKALYRQRNVIERMFGRLKDFRRIATRFDRNIISYFGALCLIAALVWWA
ncbi:MAG: IS5 family transposase [Terracidiphilus sp.]